MKVVSEQAGSIAAEFSLDELRLIFAVLSEVRNGPNAFDDEDWNDLIGQPRDLEASLIAELLPVVERLTSKL